MFQVKIEIQPWPALFAQHRESVQATGSTRGEALAKAVAACLPLVRVEVSELIRRVRELRHPSIPSTVDQPTR